MNIEGKLLGSRYEIIEKIGNGGMATVYKATDKVLKRNVAVKILRDEFTTDEEFIKRFDVEAQSAARLTHPNIVSIYDVGVEDNLHYIVMELIQGKTLKEIILKEKGPLPWKWSVNVAIQIASALETAHRNNIIHRDIKPHNIIITEDGIAKVTDFGIAKAVSNSTITAFGTTIGSVHYFSPEHARGGFTDAKSDLYSLGVVLYEMVTGQLPFDADTPVSVALKHMQEKPEEPIEVNPNVPVAVNKIIMKALQKDTTLRYQTATEMLDDLRKSLKNPDGDFVDDSEYDPTAKTQVLHTEMYNNLRGSNNDNEKDGKKDGKVKAFIKKHKKLSVFIGLILLFALSLGGTIIALVIAIIIIFLSTNYKSKIIKVLEKTMLVVWFLPPIIFAIGFILAYNNLNIFNMKGDFILMLGYSLLVVNIMIYSIKAIIKNVNANIIESSRALGCNKIKTFMKVLLPLLVQIIISTISISTITLLSEFTLSELLYSYNNKPISVVYRSEFANSTPYQAANVLVYTVIILILSILILCLIAFVNWITKKNIKFEERRE